MIEIYKYNDDTDVYESVATFNDDGTVDGTSLVADRLRNIINAHSADADTYSNAIEVVIQLRYNNGVYFAERE